MLEVGQPAPDFALPYAEGPDGKPGAKDTLCLDDFKGRILVLYFYPKDSTPGCTTESKEFSARKAAFEAAGATILGASKDSLKRHQNFITKQGLTIPLLSDEEGILCDAYGVWIKKKLYGREYMGIERATFLIDETGMIRQIWHNVKVKGHVEAVLDAVHAL